MKLQVPKKTYGSLVSKESKSCALKRKEKLRPLPWIPFYPTPTPPYKGLGN